MTEESQFAGDEVSEIDESIETSPPEYVQEPEKPSFWARLFDPTVRLAQLQANLDELNAAIARSPDVGVNYVLRGELYLKLKHYEHAVADFRDALQIVIHEVENNDWALVAQVLQDRAKRGLEKASRKLDVVPVNKVEHQQSEVEFPLKNEPETHLEEEIDEETT